VDSSHERALSKHLSNLPAHEKAAWKQRAQDAIDNEHNKNHPSWDWLAQIADWLRIPVPSAVTKTGSVSADIAATGGTWFVLKKVALFILRHP
jgi:hypothetical protein